MKEFWEQSISLLPSANKIDCFYIEYRPWIKDKTHLYRVFFRTVDAYTDHPASIPLWVESFGSTAEEALQSFIGKWSK
jgi:hypothetical protein